MYHIFSGGGVEGGDGLPAPHAAQQLPASAVVALCSTSLYAWRHVSFSPPPESHASAGGPGGGTHVTNTGELLAPSAAGVAVVFSATTTASVLHARNRKHKLERDLPAKVHAKAAIHGLKALAVATGLSGTLAVAAYGLSTQHIFPNKSLFWEKESVKEKLEAAVRSVVPGGEAFKTTGAKRPIKETTKRNRK